MFGRSLEVRFLRQTSTVNMDSTRELCITVVIFSFRVLVFCVRQTFVYYVKLTSSIGEKLSGKFFDYTKLIIYQIHGSH